MCVGILEAASNNLQSFPKKIKKLASNLEKAEVQNPQWWSVRIATFVPSKFLIGIREAKKSCPNIASAQKYISGTAKTK